MKKQSLLCLLLCGLLAIVGTACVSTIDGHYKAGFPVKDCIVKRVDRPMEQVQKSAREVLSKLGKLEVDNIAANTLQAKVTDCTVFVRMRQVDPKYTEFTVQVRRGAISDIDLAADISTRIALQLSTY